MIEEITQGKVVLLDFWGVWCGPCVKKLPATQALYEKYQDEGLVVLGIHSAQQSDDLESFLDAKELTFPIVVDTGKTAESYGVEAWPT